MPPELRLLLVLTILLIIPGWAVVIWSGAWNHWRTLQRLILAIGLSIAFYPILFYGARFLSLGPTLLVAILGLCAAGIAWRLRTQWRDEFHFEPLEGLAVILLGITLLTRLWMAHAHPFPAWSDSLHHTLLTQLTAETGHLPASLEPYFPVPLDMYHLGLYAIAAPVQWLAQVPAHTALLWTAQTLNGLCGIGIYLVLDRMVGRMGALVGIVVAGLLSHHPAFYINWGRFTQVAAQSILLIAWYVTFYTIATRRKKRNAHYLIYVAASAFLSAAVFLLHFRVAIFYLLLLGPSLLWLLWRAYQGKQTRSALLATTAIGLLALLILSPMLITMLAAYLQPRLHEAIPASLSQEQITEIRSGYYRFSLDSIWILGVRPWLLIFACIAAIWAGVRRNRLAILNIIWIVLLLLLGNTYLLEAPVLNITNLGAVVIMLYLPTALIMGSATQEALSLVKNPLRPRVNAGLAIGTLIIGLLFAVIRVGDIEPYRYFVTASDVKAMSWISNNVPADARFAVNTDFWLPDMPHGTDGGYWIPYFTGRDITAAVMLLSLANNDYRSEIITLSRLG